MFKKYGDADGCLTAIVCFIVTILILGAFYLLEAWIAQWLWNDVVGLPWFNDTEISFWQTYGLIWLAHIIFPSKSTDFKWND